MTLIQTFLGILAALLGVGAFVILYFDAKFGPVAENLKLVVEHMIRHETRIVAHDEKLKQLAAGAKK